MDNDLPVDEALPGLADFGPRRIDATLRRLDLAGLPVSVRPLKYHRGRRMTLCVTTTECGYIVKVLDKGIDRIHLVLDEMHRAHLPQVRVPTVCAVDRAMQVLVTDAFTGKTASALVAEADGHRAGSLAAMWFAPVAAANLGHLGRRLDTDRLLRPLRIAAATLPDAQSARLGGLVDDLAATEPATTTPGLVHGSFKLDHIYDDGEAVGVIDWDGYHHGAMEHDAATFLATATFLAMTEPALQTAVDAASCAFRAAVAPMLRADALEWFERRALAKIVSKLARSSRPDAATYIDRVLDVATRQRVPGIQAAMPLLVRHGRAGRPAAQRKHSRPWTRLPTADAQAEGQQHQAGDGNRGDHGDADREAGPTEAELS